MDIFYLADGKATPSTVANQHNVVVLAETIHGEANASFQIDDDISSIFTKSTEAAHRW